MRTQERRQGIRRRESRTGKAWLGKKWEGSGEVARHPPSK